MMFPTVQQAVDKLLTPIGWTAVAGTVLTGLGIIAKLLWTLTTNHAEHIQAATEKGVAISERIEQKTDTLISLANTQNVLIAGMVTGSKDISVAVAKIETIESLLRERGHSPDAK